MGATLWPIQGQERCSSVEQHSNRIESPHGLEFGVAWVHRFPTSEIHEFQVQLINVRTYSSPPMARMSALLPVSSTWLTSTPVWIAARTPSSSPIEAAVCSMKSFMRDVDIELDVMWRSLSVWRTGKSREGTTGNQRNRKEKDRSWFWSGMGKFCYVLRVFQALYIIDRLRWNRRNEAVSSESEGKKSQWAGRGKTSIDVSRFCIVSGHEARYVSHVLRRLPPSTATLCELQSASNEQLCKKM